MEILYVTMSIQSAKRVYVPACNGYVCIHMYMFMSFVMHTCLCLLPCMCAHSWMAVCLRMPLTADQDTRAA